jgi:N6-L-threonylcarbamoyladenine synthase
VFPPPELCTDNAVMIAAAGARLVARGQRDAFDREAFSRGPLGPSAP